MWLLKDLKVCKFHFEINFEKINQNVCNHLEAVFQLILILQEILKYNFSGLDTRFIHKNGEKIIFE